MATKRLDRVLSEVGLGSRRDIKKWARSGLIEVDGRIVRDPSLHIDPSIQTVRVAGESVRYRPFHYWMMNKPAGVVSAARDRVHNTVLDLLDERDRTPDLFPAGRLDIDTEGFILITDDGKLAHDILSPRQHVPKTYRATVKGRVTEADVDAVALGIALDDGYVTLPARLHILAAGDTSEVELVLREGKFHQVKRMFAALDKPVVHLRRTAIGGVCLDPALAPGEYRALIEEELARLRDRQSHLGMGPV
ncbi:MAG: pseudouridine synthase [Kyrpidia sp.]|nr:pseudouridine synthase [Kyrpidia sp.]